MPEIYENPLDSEQMFATQILTKWAEIKSLSEQYRVTKLHQSGDAEVVHDYAAKLCSIWGDLKPEVDELKNNDVFIKDFGTYEPYYYDTQRLIEDIEDDNQAVFRFEMVIKTAIKKLGFTTRSEGKR
jgi:hypothetical protein